MWIILALLTAFFAAFRIILTKHGLNKKINVYVVAWAGIFFGTIFLSLMLFFIEIPKITSDFWLGLLVSGTINIFAILLFTKAINQSEISLSIPLTNISPILLLLTSFIILGEFPSMFGLIGILLIVIGTYTLNIKQRKNGFWQPFKELTKHKAAKYIFISIILWSIAANFDKIGVRGSSPLFWAICLMSYIALGLTIIMVIKAKNFMKDIKSNMKILLPIGFVNGLSSVCHMTAISLTLVSYVISIKRTSSIMVVIMGALLFKEKGLKERLLAVIIMTLGVVMISMG